MRSLSEINCLNSACAGKGRPAIDIENVDQNAIENYIRDLALVTMTDAEDWNFRFVAVRSTSGEGLIWFTHATQAPHVAILYKKEEGRSDHLVSRFRASPLPRRPAVYFPRDWHAGRRRELERTFHSSCANFNLERISSNSGSSGSLME